MCDFGMPCGDPNGTGQHPNRAAPERAMLRGWEIEAAAFLEATGFVRPGKDILAAMGTSDDYVERRRAWKIWCAGYDYAVLVNSTTEPERAGNET